MHAANAGKYLSSMAVVLVNGIGKGLNATNITDAGFPPMLIVLIVFSSIAYLYTTYWDLVRDWGLLRFRKVKYRVRRMFFPFFFFLAFFKTLGPAH